MTKKLKKQSKTKGLRSYQITHFKFINSKKKKKITASIMTNNISFVHPIRRQIA